MLQIHIHSTLLKHLPHSPTDDQKEALQGVATYISNTSADAVFLLTGYAGTGKTTVLQSLVHGLQELKQRSVLLAPTGRAAKVLSAYTKRPAFTIHKKIYRQKSSRDGMGVFSLDRNLHKNTWFIVDEASMISNTGYEQAIFGSGRLLEDLLEYVYSAVNCHLILCGDPAQLPPVGTPLSPALDASLLKSMGFNVHQANLQEVVRQSATSGILHNATRVRKLIQQQLEQRPVFELEGFPDIKHIRGEELIESISGSYDRVGQEETMIVVNSNRMANKYNMGIRNRILYQEEEIAAGDYLMVVKNNYFWKDEEMEKPDFIANGDIARIQRILAYEELFDYHFARLQLELIDYGIEIEALVLMDTLMMDSPALPPDEGKAFFGKVLLDYQHLKTRRSQYEAVRNDHHFNALQIKFAYAVTCHKAQGGQWRHVYLDQGFLNRQEVTIDYLRWLYTALTRATDTLYLVNFSKEHFVD